MRFSVAMALSCAIHGAAATAVVCSGARLLRAGRPSASIEVSSVALSVLSHGDGTARAVSAVMPRPAAPRPDVPRTPPAADALPQVLPPDAALVALPEPDGESRVRMSESASESEDVPQVVAPPGPAAPIKPSYPRSARRRGEEGDVVVKVCVAPDGSVREAAVASSCGYPDLDAAALRAAKTATFHPAQEGGRPVASEALLTISFRLR